MRIFTGQYDRTIDAKNRIQLPSQVRSAIDPERDGQGLYVTFGLFPHTLSIFTERGFEELVARIEREFMPGPESRRFRKQFFSLVDHVDVDKQGRIVLPDRLRKKARLKEAVYLVGQNDRLDVWNREEFDRSLGINWEDDEWPDWQGFLEVTPPSKDQRA